MIDDARWPSPVRGNAKSVPWLNRLREACIESQIKEIKVVNGVGKIAGNVATISFNSTPPQAQGQTIVPFAFYNIKSSSVYAINSPGINYLQGDILTLSGGTLSAGASRTRIQVQSVGPKIGGGPLLSLSVLSSGTYTVQPTFPNALSGGSGTGAIVSQVVASDSSKTFSMRSGMMGIRSRFFGIDGPSGNQFQDPRQVIEGARNAEPFILGNFTRDLMINGDRENSLFQPTSPQFGNPIILGAPDTEVLITGIDPQGAFVSYSQIILNAPVSGNDYQAGFWLEFIDDPDLPGGSAIGDFFPYVNLKGKMFSDPSGTPFPITNAVTNNQNIIPLAVIHFNSSQTGQKYDIAQLLSGNIQTLFDAYFNKKSATDLASGLAAGSFMCWRGDWDADNLSSQYFFPGDLVTQGTISTASVGGFEMKLQYVCLNYIHGLTGTTDPASDTTDWLCLTK